MISCGYGAVRPDGPVPHRQAKSAHYLPPPRACSRTRCPSPRPLATRTVCGAGSVHHMRRAPRAKLTPSRCLISAVAFPAHPRGAVLLLAEDVAGFACPGGVGRATGGRAGQAKGDSPTGTTYRAISTACSALCVPHPSGHRAASASCYLPSTLRAGTGLQTAPEPPIIQCSDKRTRSEVRPMGWPPPPFGCAEGAHGYASRVRRPSRGIRAPGTRGVALASPFHASQRS
jgi:hypothetical protein